MPCTNSNLIYDHKICRPFEVDAIILVITDANFGRLKVAGYFIKGNSFTTEVW